MIHRWTDGLWLRPGINWKWDEVSAPLLIILIPLWLGRPEDHEDLDTWSTHYGCRLRKRFYFRWARRPTGYVPQNEPERRHYFEWGFNKRCEGRKNTP